MGRKLTYENFVANAIVNLRQPGYKGIHTVFSGFNQAFRDYYGKEADPVAAVKKLEAEGKFVLRPARGGATIYLKDETPETLRPKTNATLAKILNGSGKQKMNGSGKHAQPLVHGRAS